MEVQHNIKGKLKNAMCDECERRDNQIWRLDGNTLAKGRERDQRECA